MYCCNKFIFILAKLHETIEQYLKDEMLLKIVHLKKTNEREGLIRARLFGANLATGQVMKMFKLFIPKFIELVEIYN